MHQRFRGKDASARSHGCAFYGMILNSCSAVVFCPVFNAQKGREEETETDRNMGRYRGYTHSTKTQRETQRETGRHRERLREKERRRDRET